MELKSNNNKTNSLQSFTESQVSEKTISEFDKITCQLKEEELQFVSEISPTHFYKKGTYLLKEGEVSKKCFYVFDGIVRQYYLVDGIEKTTFFYTEGHSISSPNNAAEGIASKYYLVCMEDCKLSSTIHEDEQELYRRFPRLESLCRIEAERTTKKFQELLAEYITSSPEERYLNLLNNRPDLLNRVPQHQIASYLGIKPESLSRIRKRISQK